MLSITIGTNLDLSLEVAVLSDGMQRFHIPQLLLRLRGGDVP